jgi:hypothetical protein
MAKLSSIRQDAVSKANNIGEQTLVQIRIV